MNDSKRLAAVALALAVAALALAGMSLSASFFKPSDNRVAAPPQSEADDDEEDVELGVIMAHVQRYTEKLYFSGKAGNAPLAGFYLHELEETVEDLAKKKVVDDGMPVGEMAGAMLNPALQRLRALDFKDPAAFEKEYVALVETCNACHAATKHGFVKIKVPKTPTYQNQSFE